MERNLSDYLPLFIQDYAQIREIMNTEQVNVEKVWDDAESVMNDQFVVDATENGVRRWEKILKITPKATENLDERKFYVLARLNEKLPYTLEALSNMLSYLCGANGYTLKLDSNNYVLTVKLALASKHNFEAVEKLLTRVVPANLVTVTGLFNTHSILGGFTHEQLKAYTHKEVREEML